MVNLELAGRWDFAATTHTNNKPAPIFSGMPSSNGAWSSLELSNFIILVICVNSNSCKDVYPRWQSNFQVVLQYVPARVFIFQERL
jgi:hypothetical protein